MSQCPFANILDPDLYGGGNHHKVLAEVREKGLKGSGRLLFDQFN
jgi:hypothetical protein